VSISNRGKPPKHSLRVPGPRSRALAKRLLRVESRNVTLVSPEFPVFWAASRGSWVRDADGERYLDLTSAFGVASLGHSDPLVAKAATAQLRKMWHGMGDVHPNAVKVELLELLADIAPGDLNTSILSSSGAEAVESALKTARLRTGRPGVLSFSGAYHGLTYGTLPYTDRPEFTAPFQNQIADTAVRVPFPDSLRGPDEGQVLERVDAILGSKSGPLSGSVGAILVEPIQGRGGVRCPRPNFLRGLREIATRRGLLLIVDEIFTGFGRTGQLFAVEDSGVVPDLLCIGKALANGFPISACIANRETMAAWPLCDGEAMHTSTFLGNPLGSAMAIASIKSLLKRRLVERSRELGDWWRRLLHSELGGHSAVGEIRGRGLMIGIELVRDQKGLEPNPRLASHVVVSALRHGLILLSSGLKRNVLSLTPPLTVSRSELQLATEILKKVVHGTP
jgi:4-aminobutyrate aminotransferase / (S)-3-amino-2-methylpropionate transaminase / 5-aminovalerate transaminase